MITPATSSAATVDDAPLDAAARVDIAHILELRQSKRLTLGEKIRLHSTVLRVPQSYQLPMQETTKQKYCDIIISAAAELMRSIRAFLLLAGATRCSVPGVSAICT